MKEPEVIIELGGIGWIYEELGGGRGTQRVSELSYLPYKNLNLSLSIIYYIIIV